MSKKLLFKGGHATGMIPYEIEDFSSLYMRDARVDEKTKAYIDSVIGNSVLNLCPYRNVLVTHKYDTVEENVVTLNDCQDDEIIQLSEVQGNTMVNCCKDGSKELTLNGDIDTSGYGNVTLTEGVDGGKVDVALEGNTMVNVCDQEDPIAITKNYEVTTGNHIALQGEYDGKCRPNVYGNTLVNLVLDKDAYSSKNGTAINNNINLAYNLKAGVTYTLIRTISEFSGGVIQEAINFYDMSFYTDGTQAQDHNCQYRRNGQYISKFTPTKDVARIEIIIGMDNIDKDNGIYPTITISDYMILEGDYTNKPIPDYFTGMKSSFEDKLVPENLTEFRQFSGCFKDCVSIENDIITITNPAIDGAVCYNIKGVKPNTTYTFYFNVLEHTEGVHFNFDLYPDSYKELGSFDNVGENRIVYTMPNDVSTLESFRIYIPSGNTTTTKITKPIIVEGDYTNYDFTNYDSSKGGKYKVDYKVTGKNKFDKAQNLAIGYISIDGTVSNLSTDCKSSDFIKILPNTTYTTNNTSTESLAFYDKNKIFIKQMNSKTFTTPSNASYVRCTIKLDGFEENFQLEEGTKATTYEPYKEFTKTLYLNSPLLEGDTIEQSGNDIVHNHKCATVVFDGSDDEKWVYWKNNTDEGGLDSSLISFYLPFTNYNSLGYLFNDRFLSSGTVWQSKTEKIALNAHNTMSFQIAVLRSKLVTQNVAAFKQWLQQNPITVVYELATPTKEVISTNDKLLLDSYVNGHLDVDSIIPIDKVMFQSYGNFLQYLLPNTEYTIQFESDNTGKLSGLALNGYDAIGNLNVVKGINKFNITTKDTIIANNLWTDGIGFNMSKVVVTPKVDGDFGYFKGMKSVGEDDVNGNKIEILSSKNIAPSSKVRYTVSGIEFNFGSSIINENVYVHNISDKRIMVHTSINGKYSRGFMIIKNSKKLIELNEGEVIYCASVNYTDGWSNSNVEKARNSFIITKKENELNKKEILMNEPLRGLPNGVKDKYVMIDGKWYIERNTIQLTIDSEFIKNKTLHDYISADYPDVVGISIQNNWFKWNSALVCNNILYDGTRSINAGSLISNQEKVYAYDYIFITLNKSKLSTPNIKGFKEYLKNNPIILVGQNTTPTYEPIDYNPFEVYTDITHISNNSLIPCNMVIRNSGYNCILKPSTLYTVALDTNKSGTIGMNLGGVKGTTTNNVLKLTTPATLTDNTLRLYGKGIKGSKVRLLEGDKTNYIPGYFTGMESVFEQELVTDEKDKNYGKYKVNVKAVGKNLFGGYIKDFNNYTFDGGVYKSLKLNLKKGATYTLNPIEALLKGEYFLICDSPNPNIKEATWNGICYDGVKQPKYTFTYSKDLYLCYFNNKGTTIDRFNDFINNIKVQLEQGDTATEYEPYKENNITFYIKEPLRAVGDVKDKVYVKEDKVVVERNCAKFVLDPTQIPNRVSSTNGIYTYNLSTSNPIVNTSLGKVVCNNFPCDVNNAHSRNYANTISTVVDQSVPDGVIRIITDKNPATFKQYLQENPTTVIYQLAEPVYEEIECDLSKLALEGYENGTLFYDTNIPVTTQFYDFNVNIKDMLIPNETYYITFNADRVKDITINLSGVQVNYKTSMGYNKVPVQLGNVVNTNFSMDSRGVELNDLMISTSTSLIYVKDMNDVCVYDEASNKYSITITSTNGKESDKRVILLDYPLLRLNENTYDRLYYSNKDSRYRIDKKVFKHKFTNDYEYSKYAVETNDTYYSSFILLNEVIKDYVVITNEKVKTVKVEDDKYYFKIKWSDLGVSDKTEANGNQGVKDFFNNNEVYLYYATDGFVEIVDGLTRQTLKVYQPETFMKFLGNTTTTVTILIPMKNV